METIHVLIVSDNRSDIAQICGLLAASSGATILFHVELETSYASALRSLVRNQYDVYLVDQMVTGSQESGADLVKKANAGGCRSPVLVLTSLPDEDVLSTLDDAGAAGHINKHLDLQERTLYNAIRTAIKYNKDVTEIREQLRDLQQQVAGLIQAFDRRT